MSGNEVNCYTLRRMTPLNDPPQKDVWHMEISPAGALAHLSKEVGCILHLCSDGADADFVLERQQAIPAPRGTGWQAGETIESFYVRRVLSGA